MDDGINLPEDFGDQFRVADVAVPEFEAGVLEDIGRQIVEVAGISQGVENVDVGATMSAHKFPDEV